MNTTSQGSLPVPLAWLRAGWAILMTLMIVTLVLGVGVFVERFDASNFGTSDPQLVQTTIVLNYGVLAIVVALLAFVMFASSLIFWKAEGQTSGVLLAFTLLIYWTTDSTPFDLLTHSDQTPLSLYFRAPILMLRAAALPLTLALLLTFPDGRVSPPWTRWLLLGYSILTLLYLLFPDLPTNTIYGPTWRRTPELSFLFAILPFLVGMYTQVQRYRSSAGETRNQLKWTVFGLVIMIVGVMLYYGIYAFFAPMFDVNDPTGNVVNILALEVIRQFTQLVLAVIVPIICFMIAIFRYRLWSADPIINRALVYSAFVGTLSLIYFVSIVVVGLFVNTINFLVSIPVTLFMLIIFQPLRERIQKTVDRLMFGDRGDPLAVLSQFDSQVTLTETTDRALFAIAAMLAEALKVPCVLVTMLLNDGERSLSATYGHSSGRLRVSRFPMAYGERKVGEIALYQDAGDRPFTPTERQLIEMVTRQTALIVNSIQLNTALQQSRQTIIAAREEERRRLRRDLHDGLGPRLAAHTLKVGKARSLIPQQPTRASDILSSVEADLTASLGEIRHLVESLRPPILDQLGLVGALQEYIAPLTSSVNDGATTQFLFAVSSQVPELPAAVEVAAYRIVTEAVANVVRHAHAATCQVEIGAEQDLFIRISDDGVGLPTSIRHGVGMNSMRERAEEVGGHTFFSSVIPSGTLVEVRLPLS